LVVADSVLSNLNGELPPDMKVLLGQLQDQGKQTLRGRSGTVRLWTKSA
jgi:hypothetical protein